VPIVRLPCDHVVTLVSIPAFNFSAPLPLINDERGKMPSIPVKIERYGVFHANKERS
jgi:hypothetical protein